MYSIKSGLDQKLFDTSDADWVMAAKFTALTAIMNESNRVVKKNLLAVEVSPKILYPFQPSK